MGYLKEFLTEINNRNFHKFLVLWEEYCTSDTVDTEEFSQLLKAIKVSHLATHFGQIAETALPLWKTIEDKGESYETLRLLIDLQTTNSPELVDLTIETLQNAHGNDPKFADRIKLAGLRNRENFQGAISRYNLLAHMAKNNMVFHTGGWGTGEIMDVSFVREHLAVEFENVGGRKDISFPNAFKTLIVLPDSHFFAKRFSNPDQLEREGREDPVALIKLLLRDLGPKTAVEIKDELCELVIPEKDWSKWWQWARTKIKKDPLIGSPGTVKEPFYLRKAELSSEELLQTAMQHKKDHTEAIQIIYNFLRDNPNIVKEAEASSAIQTRLAELLEAPSITDSEQLQIYLLLDLFFKTAETDKQITKYLEKHKNIDTAISFISIAALKKQALVAVRELRKDWPSLFLTLLFTNSQAQLRDYLLRELNQDEETRELLGQCLQRLLVSPAESPEFFIWYFQKLIEEKKGNIPFQNEEGKLQFFEAFFILFNALETQPENKDLLKKMHTLLSANRYALIRELLKGTSLSLAKELLLLMSKCQTLSGHDIQNLRSLVEVVHPSLNHPKQKKEIQEDDLDEEIWTTEAGYLKTQERIRHIGTIEVIENAKEIEAARALGDLRENSEFKFAQEKRARLQSELKTLSSQLSRARVITPDDIHPTQIGVGNVVEVEGAKGKKICYTILGPWDADVERNILSLNSKLAQAMIGKKTGDRFTFRSEEYKVLSVESFFKK